MLTEKIEDKKKVMLIVWKWEGLTHINERILSQKEFNAYFKDITRGNISVNEEQGFYKEYQVEKSALCPNASVVAASIYKADANTRKLLYKLIGHYAKPDCEMVVFLHRANFYTDEDVNDLLNQFDDRVSKCFLFADGRDFIYYKTQKSGFLDDVGNIMSGLDKDTRLHVSTIEGDMIKQPYFDRVWEYYQAEFETKVFQLKEELWEQWLPYLLPDQPVVIKKSDLVQAIRQRDDKVLYYRLKSFNGLYDALKNLDAKKDYEEKSMLEEEIKMVVNMEKRYKESYFFDDCIKNINHHKKNERAFVAEAYEEVKADFQKIIFEDTSGVIQKAELLQLADKLNYLVKIIPGELD